jgi:NAD(P)-dependent dehydrogenase (short-subunit alcohol dehydrogenase family)
MRTVGPDDTAFITGGAQGIGLGIARALAAHGVKLALADIDATKLGAAAEELSARTRVSTYVLDVRDRQAFAEVADKAEADLGPVTLLFNNAGVAGGRHVTQMDYDSWDWMLGVNLNGVINGIQTFVPRMLERNQGGYVVNTASGAGVVECGTGFLYTTSKFAVVGLSESLHQELAPFGIGVSVLCPGRVATDIVRNTWGLDRPEADDMDPVMRASLEEGSKSLQTGTSPDRVAELVLDAMRRGRLHIFTDGDLHDMVTARFEQLIEAVDGWASDA